jgi:glycosyltransferase involved in cell wall biosynthesis
MRSLKRPGRTHIHYRESDGKVRVLQLISSGGYYGAESMLLNLCLARQKAGCEDNLALFDNRHQPNTELYEQARRARLKVHQVRCRGRVDWLAVREIRSLIQSERINLLHTHGYKANLYGYLAARWEGKPAVATCHNWVGGTPVLGVYNRLDRMVLKRFRALAAVSDEVRERLVSSGIPRERIRAIANGIDMQASDTAHPARFPGIRIVRGKVIGMVARLDLQKGIEYLLAAVRELCNYIDGLAVILVGEGPDRMAIERLVQQLGLQQNVLLAGRRTDMAAVYAAIDMFVLPSLNEGLPMTVLEAMAAGKAVIATSVGGVPSVISHGETGLMVAPRDAAALRDAISILLEDPDLRKRLGKQAREWAMRHCTSDAMAQKYHQMYEDVLQEALPVPAQRALGRPEAKTQP